MSSSEWQRPETDPFARVWAEVKRVRRDAEQRVNYLLRNAGLRVAEGALHVLQRLVVEGDQEVTGSLDVSGDAEFTGDTSIGGQLDVTGETTLGGDTDVTGRLGVTGRTTLGGDTSITGDTDVTGDLDVEGRAGFTGDTTIGGNLAVVGTLSLPAGIIDNDALANPLTFDASWDQSEGFSTPAGNFVVASCSITVPAGFTRMLMYTTAVLRARNTESSSEYLDAWISYRINGGGYDYGTVDTRADVGAGRSGVAVVPGVWSEPVSPGDVYDFRLMGWTQEAWNATSTNYARIEVACLFTR